MPVYNFGSINLECEKRYLIVQKGSKIKVSKSKIVQQSRFKIVPNLRLKKVPTSHIFNYKVTYLKIN